MSLLNFFRRRETAPMARERLQILLAHERSSYGGKPDLLQVLHKEILAVIGKHVKVDDGNVQVTMERGAAVSTLEIDVEIPNGAPNITPRAARRRARAAA